KSISLTGPLPPFDATWLRDALAETLGRPAESSERAFPFVPPPEPCPQSGSTLNYRLICPDSHARSLAAVAALNTVWNGIIGLVACEAWWCGPQVQWGMLLFLVPFALVGLVFLVLLGIVFYYFAVHLRIRRTIVELSEFPLRCGARVEAFVLQAGRLPLRRL